ncbi:hypothetical protein V1478_018397 [Vespula squamosa]|uniref:Uncharacterized protein n=1 Tax=Vespula squamosa TaxID=30214 RepID=A0ABD1ZVL2_VESSQ
MLTLLLRYQPRVLPMDMQSLIGIWDRLEDREQDFRGTRSKKAPSFGLERKRDYREYIGATKAALSTSFKDSAAEGMGTRLTGVSKREHGWSEGAIWLGSIYETADSPDSTITEERRGREEKDRPLVLSFSIEFCFLGCGIGRIPKTLYPSPKEVAFEPDPLPIHSGPSNYNLLGIGARRRQRQRRRQQRPRRRRKEKQEEEEEKKEEEEEEAAVYRLDEASRRLASREGFPYPIPWLGVGATGAAAADARARVVTRVVVACWIPIHWSCFNAAGFRDAKY